MSGLGGALTLRARQVREMLASLRSLDVRLAERDRAFGARLDAIEEQLRAVGSLLEDSREQSSAALAAIRLVADEEAESRRRVAALRGSGAYGLPFEDPAPLVTIPIPTYRNAEGLATRSIPSALAQTYENIEVLVIGDASPPEVEEAARSFDDPRLTFTNLARRGPYPADAEERWRVAGTMPLNEGLQSARGGWIAILNDDDTFRPDHVERLVALAQAERAEVAYGRMAMRHPEGHVIDELGVFPPEHGQFGWQMALMHEQMRFFGYSLGAAVFGEPGDWHLCRRMLRAGVRFAMTDETLGDYYPSRLWNPSAMHED